MSQLVSRISEHSGMMVKSCGLAGVITTICDLATPVGYYAGQVFAVSVVVLVLLVAANLFGVRREPVVVGIYFSLMLVVLSGILISYPKTTEAVEKGVLASKVPALESFQNSLGLLEADVAEIKQNTKAIADNTKSTSQQVKTLKKETSEDPRKELANMGIPWTVTAFGEAIDNADERTIALFIAGGMKLRRARDVQGYPNEEWLFRTSEKNTHRALELFHMLKRSGADMDPDYWGYFHQAIFSENLSLVKFFHKEGFDINAPYNGDIATFNFLELNNISPLCYAELVHKFGQSEYYVDYGYGENTQRIVDYLQNAGAKSFGSGSMGTTSVSLSRGVSSLPVSIDCN